MATHQSTDFAAVAGQLVANGVRPMAPAIALEGEGSRTILNNLATINGLIPKVGKILIHDTRIFDSPLEPYIQKSDMPFGVALEQAGFSVPATNKINDGVCVPRGHVPMESQIDLCNFAQDISIDIKDREINAGVMDQGTAEKVIANKMRTIAKRNSISRYRAWIQILSDTIPSTSARSVVSTDASDGQGSAVTYSVAIPGYAGKVETLNNGTAIPEVEPGTAASLDVDDVELMIQSLQDNAADMMYESSAYNKLGIVTYCADKPLCIVEKKILNAADRALSKSSTYHNGWTSKGMREIIGEFAQVVEIDSFASLPTNTAHGNKRNLAVLLDRESMLDVSITQSTESQRCAKQRTTGYNFQCENIFALWKGAPSYALLAKTQV